MEWILAVAVPVLLVLTVLVADLFEGPKTAFVGQLAAVPMLAAVFGGVGRTVLVSAVTLGSAALFGVLASDGNAPAQRVRLAAIAVFSAIAVVASGLRERQAAQLRRVQSVAATATRALLRPLPSAVGGMAVAVRYVSADREAAIGGDLYEVVQTRFGVRAVVGDVRGKGLQAVRLAAVTLGAFREAAHREADLAGIVTAVDAAVTREGGDEDFVTAVILHVGPDRLAAVSCGHPAPWVVDGAGGRELHLPAGLPLGLGGGGDQVDLRLAPGSRLARRSRRAGRRPAAPARAPPAQRRRRHPGRRGAPPAPAPGGRTPPRRRGRAAAPPGVTSRGSGTRPAASCLTAGRRR